MTTVGLITYHFPHLKTEQVLQKLLQKKEKGNYDYKIYALPFKPQKQRGLFKHRLDQLEAVIMPKIKTWPLSLPDCQSIQITGPLLDRSLSWDNRGDDKPYDRGNKRIRER